VLHAAGYDQHDGLYDLRCDHCWKLIRKGTWYRRTDKIVQHTKPCKAHQETVEVW
jgi:hypothetical protein